ncbi:hypothetical protein GCM10010978_30190 [Compostibacillus humi]|uniref:Uncharacterized protein n=1 Tax=Compostibacillus humi TaxID=1245525 RepID=A0A8J2XHG9_9BACI|nr:hypothetical protein GCM10010978_30190 [Compostibacillus humi]
MPSPVWSKGILDADFAIKLGRIKKYKVIEEILPLYIQKIFIHEYVYSNEILIPKSAKDQIDELIKKDRAEIVNEDDISEIGPYALILYEDTIEKLRKAKKREKMAAAGEKLFLLLLRKQQTFHTFYPMSQISKHS